jgi:peroxiredoxin
MIGVHTPETAEEREREKVAAKLKELGITYPVLLDPDARNWRRWGQQYWPTVYLIDRRGRVRYAWVGELEFRNAGGERTMTRLLQELLAEPK